MKSIIDRSNSKMLYECHKNVSEPLCLKHENVIFEKQDQKAVNVCCQNAKQASAKNLIQKLRK